MSIANLITRTFTGAAAAAVLAFGFSAGAAAADKVIRIGVSQCPMRTSSTSSNLSLKKRA